MPRVITSPASITRFIPCRSRYCSRCSREQKSPSRRSQSRERDFPQNWQAVALMADLIIKTSPTLLPQKLEMFLVIGGALPLVNPRRQYLLITNGSREILSKVNGTN